MNTWRTPGSIIKDAAKSGIIIGGFNVFSVDDAIEVVRAAEEINTPVMLMVNKVGISYMPVEIWASVLRPIAKRASIPVIVHLDHTTDMDVIRRACKSGFDSVMFDGSQFPLEENICQTRIAAQIAHASGVLLEAEIGAVGYSDGAAGLDYVAAMTDPEEAARFEKESYVDWMAISIGNVHRMQEQAAAIDFALLNKIESCTDVPLVIHGSTGITDEDMVKLRNTRVAKVNIGTALRMAFGNTLREEITSKPLVFDRIELFKEPLAALREAAKERLKILSAQDGQYQ